MLTDLINRTLEIDSYDGAAPGRSHQEQTGRCDTSVGKACVSLGPQALEAPQVPTVLALQQIIRGMVRRTVSMTPGPVPGAGLPP